MAVRVVGPMQWIVYPALIAIAATVILATPVKLFGLTLPEPVLPMVLAFSWPLIRPSVLAPLVLLGLGLWLDGFWEGAFGLWGLALSAVYGVVLLSRSFLLGQETSVLFVWYSACTLMAFLMAYAVVSLGSPTAPSVLATIAQIVPTLLVFPLAHIMIERFDDGDVRFR
ncbi:MAG: hypothetical protein ACOH1H_01240 [Brevundimonas sp.]|jgi:rod shape-determining protein MreD